MKSCLGLLLSLLILVAVLGTGAFIWHLCSTSSFSLSGTPSTSSANP
ncbi:MAG: hypothetical protein QM680_06785 [Luteolibacter sp.]